MKPIYNCACLILFLLIASFSPALSQDWLEVAPKGKEIMANNKIVRTFIVTLNPGEKEPTHTDPAHVYYVITAGKAKVKYTDGKENVAEVNVGDCGYSDAERPHTIENVGTTVLKFLVVELVEHPYKK